MQRLGEYELLGEIARGGMGAVFRARDPRLGREVAIKVLTSSTEHQLRRFVREARALGRLRHRNIVSVHFVGEQGGRPFIVMDLVPGETLEARLARGPLAPREAAAVVAKVARALAHAHAQGVLHRDLKPANVIVSPDGEPHLTDFGLAKGASDSLSGTLTRDGNFLGTPGYWPPEQARGYHDAIGPRSDVYGLGATLYALLCGRPPFVGENLLEYMAAVDQDPEPPSAHRSGLDPALEAICMRAIAREPAARLPSAEAFAEALEGYVRGAPPTWSLRSPRRAAWRWVALLVAAAGVTLLVALALGSGRRPPGDDGPAKPGPAPGSPPASASPVAPVVAPRSPAEQARDAAEAALRRADETRGTPSEEALLLEAAAADPTFARPHRRLAELALSRNEPRIAERAAAHALELDPQDPSACLLRAHALARLDRPEEAYPPLCQRAAALAPGDVEPLLFAATYATRARRKEVVTEALERAARLAPDDPRVLSLRGAVLIKDERPAEAVPLLERALERVPEVASVWVDLARAREALGDRTGARVAASRATELAPRDASAWFILGRVLARLDVRDEALAALRRAVECDPEHLDAWSELGLALAEAGEAREALAALDRVLARRPRSVRELTNRALLLAQVGENEAALAAFDRVLALAPDLPRIRHDRAVTLVNLGRLDEAAAALRGLVAQDGTDELASLNLVRVLRRLGKDPEAEELLEGFLGRVGESSDGFALRGAFRLDREDFAGAIAAYDRALELDPRLDVALCNRGLARFRLGQNEAAIADFDAALALAPGDPLVLSNRAHALREVGRGDEAVADLQAAVAAETDPPAVLGRRRELAKLLADLGRHVEALAAWTEVVLAAPDDGDGYVARATSAIALDRFQEAQADLARAIDLTAPTDRARIQVLSETLDALKRKVAVAAEKAKGAGAPPAGGSGARTPEAH